MVVMDGETSNSTFSEIFRKVHPDRYLEMFIAEQNMVGVAMGLSRRGKIPFISTFAAFLTRAFDQIRMSQYSKSNIKFCGSHGGVSIGEDGPSQMGLEDIAMFRTLLNSVVLYPCDAVSCEKLVHLTAQHQGNVYLRTTRSATPILYSSNGEDDLINHEFKIGGSCVLKSSDNDQVTVIGAGITLHEALAAYEELKKENINIRIVDLYSIKPIDITTLQKAAQETKAIITVEDHHHEGGLGEAVLYCLAELAKVQVEVHILAVKKEPHSAKPDELLSYEEIDKNAIIKAVKNIINEK
jgi:transketolase